MLRYLFFVLVLVKCVPLFTAEQDDLKYSVESQSQKCVIGIFVRTSNALFHEDASTLWEKFAHDEIKTKIPNRIDDNVLAVYTNYAGDFRGPFTYLLGCEVAHLSTIPDGMVGIRIPSQKYAVFTLSGAFPASLIHLWQGIWASSLPRAYTTDFEVYPASFNPQNNSAMQVFIALKKKD